MTRGMGGPGRPLEELDTVVLFDVMAEVANGLRGAYIARADRAEAAGNSQEVSRWRELEIAVHRRRYALHPDDRDAVITAIEEWTTW